MPLANIRSAIAIKESYGLLQHWQKFSSRLAIACALSWIAACQPNQAAQPQAAPKTQAVAAANPAKGPANSSDSNSNPLGRNTAEALDTQQLSESFPAADLDFAFSLNIAALREVSSLHSLLQEWLSKERQQQLQERFGLKFQELDEVLYLSYPLSSILALKSQKIPQGSAAHFFEEQKNAKDESVGALRLLIGTHGSKGMSAYLELPPRLRAYSRGDHETLRIAQWMALGKLKRVNSVGHSALAEATGGDFLKCAAPSKERCIADSLLQFPTDQSALQHSSLFAVRAEFITKQERILLKLRISASYENKATAQRELLDTIRQLLQEKPFAELGFGEPKAIDTSGELLEYEIEGSAERLFLALFSEQLDKI